MYVHITESPYSTSTHTKTPQSLIAHPQAAPFISPVDPVLDHAPNYLTCVYIHIYICVSIYDMCRFMMSAATMHTLGASGACNSGFNPDPPITHPK